MANFRIPSAVFVTGILLAMTTPCVAATSAHGHEKLATPEPPARFGLHGMLLFSDGQQLFASHLPMFHAPHDVQVVLRIALADSHQQRALVEQLTKTPTAYWTLEPELFDLNRLGKQPPALHSFKAKLYQGHFERGGRFMFESNVRVQQVDWFYPLQKDNNATSRFQRLTQQPQRCLYMYRITRQPSFDQALVVKPTHATALVHCPAVVHVPANPQTAAASMRAQLNADVTSVYLEIGDLQ